MDKYKETMRKLADLRDDWQSTGNRAAREIEQIFPELKDEDEDTQIRRVLLCLIKSCYETGGFALSRQDYELFSHWLKRDNEQLNSWPNVTCSTCFAKCLYRRENNPDM